MQNNNKKINKTALKIRTPTFISLTCFGPLFQHQATLKQCAKTKNLIELTKKGIPIARSNCQAQSGTQNKFGKDSFQEQRDNPNKNGKRWFPGTPNKKKFLLNLIFFSKRDSVYFMFFVNEMGSVAASNKTL